MLSLFVHPMRFYRGYLLDDNAYIHSRIYASLAQHTGDISAYTYGRTMMMEERTHLLRQMKDMKILKDDHIVDDVCV